MFSVCSLSASGSGQMSSYLRHSSVLWPCEKHMPRHAYTARSKFFISFVYFFCPQSSLLGVASEGSKGLLFKVCRLRCVVSLLWSTGCRAWASVVAARRFTSCIPMPVESSVAGETFPDQGSNLSPLALAGGLLSTVPPRKSHTVVFKIDNPKTYTVQHREPSSILWNNLNGKEFENE